MVVLDQLQSDYHLAVLSGAKRAASERKAKLFVVAGGRLAKAPATDPRNRIYESLGEAHVDGFLLLTGCLSNYSGQSRLEEFMQPFAGRRVVAIGAPAPHAALVSVDGQKGIDDLVSHLISEHGRTRLAFLAAHPGSAESAVRLAGYRAALERAGLSYDRRLVVHTGFERADGASGVSELFDRRGFRSGTIDAIACVNDETAFGAIEELHRRGIGVPRPVAVTGFDDELAAEIANPPLTTVAQRAREQGEQGVHALVDAWASGEAVQPRIVSPLVRFRQSCGCLERSVRREGSGRNLD